VTVTEGLGGGRGVDPVPPVTGDRNRTGRLCQVDPVFSRVAGRPPQGRRDGPLRAPSWWHPECRWPLKLVAVLGDTLSRSNKAVLIR
jgi:hypothetical protein